MNNVTATDYAREVYHWQAEAEKLRLQLIQQAEHILTLEAQIDALREQVDRLLAEAAHA